DTTTSPRISLLSLHDALPILADPGNLVRANDVTPLVVINQVSPIRVGFGIPERQLPLLKKHLEQGSLRVEARAPGDDQHTSEGQDRKSTRLNYSHQIISYAVF